LIEKVIEKLIGKVIGKEIGRVMMTRQKGQWGVQQEKAVAMREDRTIGGHCAQMLWRLDEVGMASRIERMKRKRERKGGKSKRTSRQ
jgi:hypothetical protein